MNSEKWIDHLTRWKEFLDVRLSYAKDDGEREKTTRQLTAIERVRHSAVLNPRLLIEFINPVSEANLIDEKIKTYYLELNESQQEAVRHAINSNNCLSLIQGPPGTGKTQVITEICLQLYHRDPNIKILVCSETHVAVNNLITRISKLDSTIKCIRIRDKEQDSDTDDFSPRAVMDAYQKWLINACNDHDVVEIIKETIPKVETRGLEKALALSANVVGMTCNRVGAYRFMDTTEMFDYAIIDEVCKATLPEILMPLTVSMKAVLVGDPRQLPPVFCSEDRDIIRNIEHCNLQHYMYIDELFSRSENTVLLDTQYRMEKSIGNLISNLFYEGILRNGRVESIMNSLLWIDYEPSQMWPDSYESTDGNPMIRNSDECILIGKILNRIERITNSEKDVAVIVPYRQQVVELRKTIYAYSKLRVFIDTVDGFQGKEADIVIFGITRTTGPFRFLADERRLNVALSRAKDQLIIVGNREYAEKKRLLAKIADACKVVNDYPEL